MKNATLIKTIKNLIEKNNEYIINKKYIFV